MGKSVREGADGVFLDTSGLTELSKALRQAGSDMNKEFRTSMRNIGKKVAMDAREEVAPYSDSIPETIRSSASGVKVTVSAGAPGKPLARLYEVGNVNRANDGVTFTHPDIPSVYSTNRKSWKWSKQERHKFLRPAVEKNQEQIGDEVTRAANEAFKSAGFRDEA